MAHFTATMNVRKRNSGSESSRSDYALILAMLFSMMPMTAR